MAPEFLIELGQTKLGLKKKKRQKYSTCTIRIFTSQNQQCPCMATSERLFLSRWIIWALSATPPADLALPSWTIIFYFLFSLHCRVFLPLPAINANGFAQISSCYLLSLKNLISSLDLNINMQKKKFRHVSPTLPSSQIYHHLYPRVYRRSLLACFTGTLNNVQNWSHPLPPKHIGQGILVSDTYLSKTESWTRALPSVISHLIKSSLECVLCVPNRHLLSPFWFLI